LQCDFWRLLFYSFCRIELSFHSFILLNVIIVFEYMCLNGTNNTWNDDMQSNFQILDLIFTSTNITNRSTHSSISRRIQNTFINRNYKRNFLCQFCFNVKTYINAFYTCDAMRCDAKQRASSDKALSSNQTHHSKDADYSDQNSSTKLGIWLTSCVLFLEICVLWNI